MPSFQPLVGDGCRRNARHESDGTPQGLVLVLLLVLAAIAVPTVTTALELPAVGCPMAHCDARMSDNAGLPPPEGDVAEIWHRTEGDGEGAGSAHGLGCAGNGTVVACTYAAVHDALVVYDYDGERLWSSGDQLGGFAAASAPMVLADGSVIACDDLRITRFGPGGQVIWNTPFPVRAVPISPVATAQGHIVVATLGGPIFAFDATDGTFLDQLMIRRNPGDAEYYQTRNTPGVRGQRVYVSMEHSRFQTLGLLAAVDVTPRTNRRGYRLSKAWAVEFGAPSAASPLVIDDTVYFDSFREKAFGPLAPRVYALRDGGDRAELRFQVLTPYAVLASLAQDPRGGFWYFSHTLPELSRRDAITGDLLQSIDVSALLSISGDFVPGSAMTIAGSPEQPVMLVAVKSMTGSPNFVVAIDLVNETLLWAHDTGEESSAGQFPVVMGADGPRVVFSSRTSGARAVGEGL